MFCPQSLSTGNWPETAFWEISPETCPLTSRGWQTPDREFCVIRDRRRYRYCRISLSRRDRPESASISVYPTIWELSLAGAEGSIANGYWHARRLTFLMGGTYHKLEWLRMVGDVVFLFADALPITLGALRSVWKRDLSPTA